MISVVLLISQFFQDELVFHRDDINQGQWWRILSGNLTHANYPHLFMNLAGLWILGFLFLDSLNTKTFIICTLLLCLFVGMGLYLFNHELLKYYGFSGVLYGLFLIGGTTALLHKDFFTGVAVILLVCGKVIWDFFIGGSTTSAELIGIPVATDAHLYGIIGAAILSVLLIINKRIFKTHPP